MQPDHLPDVITIDGPAASGKSTIGLMLAQRLGYLCLDTGSMYRALTLAAIWNGISLDDEAAVVQLAVDCDLDILPVAEETDGRHYTVLLEGVDATWDLRLPEVDAFVSQISTYPEVRAEMVRRQRAVRRRAPAIIIRRQGGGLQETYTVRKLSYGVGVERTFPVHTPTVAKLEVLKKGDVRRAKLYYVRDRVGKAARIKEKRDA